MSAKLEIIKKIRQENVKNIDIYAPSDGVREIYADGAEIMFGVPISKLQFDSADGIEKQDDISVEKREIKTHIENRCLNFENDIQILANVVKSQKKLIEYNAIYNAFLLGQISEEEFIEESESYAYSPQHIDTEILLNNLKCLFKYIGSDFTSSELADIFQCKYENVEKILKQLPVNTSVTAI